MLPFFTFEDIDMPTIPSLTLSLWIKASATVWFQHQLVHCLDTTWFCFSFSFATLHSFTKSLNYWNTSMSVRTKICNSAFIQFT